MPKLILALATPLDWASQMQMSLALPVCELRAVLSDVQSALMRVLLDWYSDLDLAADWANGRARRHAVRSANRDTVLVMMKSLRKFAE